MRGVFGRVPVWCAGMCWVAALGGCGASVHGEVDGDEAGAGLEDSQVAGRAGAPGARTDGPAAQSLERPVPLADAPIRSPEDGRGGSWRYPVSLEGLGTGPCRERTGQQIVDQIMAEVPRLSGFSELLVVSPEGAISAGSGQPVEGSTTDPEGKAEARRHLVLVSDGAFGVVFYRGLDCPVGMCDRGEFIYFMTDGTCQPQQVGAYTAVAGDGCLMPSGRPRWGWPRPLDPWDDCTTDFSPQDISGSYAGLSLGKVKVCEGDLELDASGSVPMLDVTLTIDQGADLATAVVSLQDTGSAWIDGISIDAEVSRKWVHARYEEVIDGECPVLRRHTLDVDMGAGWRGRYSPLFGLFMVEETRAPGCSPSTPVCLHVLQGHLRPAL
ncbi:MAG: hypothetical protein OXU20_35815 [Myxococcales bacterium]|nr:hypothetical protein [Myxococcales bacterium]